MEIVASIVVSVVFVGLGAFFLFSSNKRLRPEQDRALRVEPIYQPVEVSEQRLKKLKERYGSLQGEYRQNLKKLQDTENKQSLHELGIGTTDQTLYELPDTRKSMETLQAELVTIKEKIKRLRSQKQACQCGYGKDIVLNNSRAEAKKLFNREIRLRLRCLDNEFKMANAIVNWNNINRLIKRCEVAFDEINESGKIVKTYLRRPYRDLKIDELKLNFEIKNLKAEIKEEEREQRQIEREAKQAEARLKADAEKAKREREIMEKLVAKEVAKINTASKEQLELIELHKRQLQELRDKEARAISMAQLTRAGYVYVLSNEASFGSGVCKIGMTRRLDPNVRVRELGDASVPELFDVHAFAYSDDAPALENFLHETFDRRRINLVNKRKEFFRVDVESVLSVMREYKKPIELQTFFDGGAKATTLNS